MLNGAKLQPLFMGDTENKAALGVVVFLVVFLSLTVVWQIVDLWGFAAQLKGQSQQLPNTHLTINVATRAEGSELLFGKLKQHTKERVNTKYALLGIMMSTDPKKSKAIIQLPGEEPKIYTVGEQVNGLKVKGVQKDRVILSGYDSEESLYISWNKAGQDSTNMGTENSEVEDSPADVTVYNTTPEADEVPATEQVEQVIEKTVQTISNTTSPQIDQEQLAKIRERLKEFRGKEGMRGFGGRFGAGF